MYGRKLKLSVKGVKGWWVKINVFRGENKKNKKINFHSKNYFLRGQTLHTLQIHIYKIRYKNNLVNYIYLGILK